MAFVFVCLSVCLICCSLRHSINKEAQEGAKKAVELLGSMADGVGVVAVDSISDDIWQEILGCRKPSDLRHAPRVVACFPNLDDADTIEDVQVSRAYNQSNTGTLLLFYILTPAICMYLAGVVREGGNRLVHPLLPCGGDARSAS